LREIEEETNSKAVITRFIGVYSSPPSQTYHYEYGSVQYVTSYFEARLTSSITPGFSNHETMELQYFKPDCLPENLALMNDYWLADAQDKQQVFIR